MKKYIFKPYSKIFPLLFEKEKARIREAVKENVLIEHVGSTAIPEMGGKGIIDIAIAVEAEMMGLVSEELETCGYEFHSEFSTEERLYFKNHHADLEDGNRSYHIHLTFPESLDWKGFLGFRDYLIKNPEMAREYVIIKQKAVAEADNDGEKYRKIKEPVIKKVYDILFER
jgi:GrpB-like predicted nucleotidyltransferase (UPF0157 family)